MKIPIFVLTGFLCTGKTTLLRHLLQSPQFRQSAVIMNEFGEIGIDHDLVREVEGEHTTLLNAGCVCCTIRSDLVAILHELFLKRVRMVIPEFQYVFIEATGLADPVNLVQTILNDPIIQQYYQLEGLLNLVDAQHVLTHIEHYPTIKKQLRLADHVLLTKTDLISAEQKKQIYDMFYQLNTGVQIQEVIHGQLDPAMLTYFKKVHLDAFLHDDMCPQNHHHVQEDQTPHTHQTISLESVLTFNWEHSGHFSCPPEIIQAQFTALLKQCGAHILRIKGIFYCGSSTTPYLFQGMQHVLYPYEQIKTGLISKEKPHNKLVVLYDADQIDPTCLAQLSAFFYHRT